MAKLQKLYLKLKQKINSNTQFRLHFIVWIIYFLLINLNYYIGTGGKNNLINSFSHILIVAVVIFYGNVFVVSSYFLPRRQYFGELLGIIALFIIFGVCRYILDFQLLPLLGEEYKYYKVLDGRFFLDTGWFSIQYLLLSFGYWFALQTIKTEREKNTMLLKLIDYEKKVYQLEMDFLRSQISPHFIYNVLSSVYTKVSKLSPDIAEPIILLSEIMSYTTKSSKSDEEVLLEEELENIERFIALERFRYGDSFHVKYTVNGYADTEDKILPLVLLTFIENAFKYGDRSNLENPISITINIDDKSLTFICKNLKQRKSSTKKSNKIGVSNTTRRLELKYPHRYTLNIDNTTDEYIVFFKLILS
ncbi:MAG: histidine kinase [Arcicella sp.]|jgi:sensor histidine kinase YesM|nr:histidine kinase [Arcicella sp.]